MADRNSDVQQKLQNLNHDEQIAYLSEAGNVAPVVQALRLELDQRTAETLHLSDEIAAVFDVIEALDRRSGAHDQFQEAFQDREQRIKAQHM